MPLNAGQVEVTGSSPCAADGPARETELDIDVQPVDIARFYDELLNTALGLPVEQIATASLLLLAPANPVGLAAGSRYNSQGCDINRDFAAFRTTEAQAIRRAIDKVQPRLARP